MGEGGRLVSASGGSREGIFKAVYTGRYGKHNIGVAIKYNLQRGARRNVTSGACSAASSPSSMPEVEGRRGGVPKACKESAGRVSCGSGPIMGQKAKTNRAAGRRTPRESSHDIDRRNPTELADAEPDTARRAGSRSVSVARQGFRGGTRASSEGWSPQEGRSATRVGQSRAGLRSLSISRKGAQVQLCGNSASPEIPALTRPRPGRALESSHHGLGRKDGWHSIDPDKCNSSLKRKEIKIKPFKPKDKSQGAVLKVITKMLEENEQLRERLLQCSQKVTDVSQRTESVFGWI